MYLERLRLKNVSHVVLRRTQIEAFVLRRWLRSTPLQVTETVNGMFLAVSSLSLRWFNKVDPGLPRTILIIPGRNTPLKAEKWWFWHASHLKQWRVRTRSPTIFHQVGSLGENPGRTILYWLQSINYQHELVLVEVHDQESSLAAWLKSDDDLRAPNQLIWVFQIAAACV